MITIGFYGRLAERLGRQVDLDLPDGVSLSELRAYFDGLDADKVRALVNDETALDDIWVYPGDRVDFLPPLSGG
ncbi:MAG TPA: MoaD/ThiS family protein [Allosphingosinicella sp.]|nr:MoaD/ThiS family protein [Allosphingosinicella sp.]